MKIEEARRLYDSAIKHEGCVFLKTKHKPHFKMNGERVILARVLLSIKLNRDLLPKHCACHHCDIPRCINPNHLFEGTYKDNIQDARKKGRLNYPKPWTKNGRNRGRTTALNIHYAKKLTLEKAQEIKRLYFEEGLTQTEIAKRFGIGQTMVSRIIKNISWSFTSSIECANT